MPSVVRAQRNSYVTVTFRPAEKVELERMAAASGNSLSSWCRWVLLNALPKKAGDVVDG